MTTAARYTAEITSRQGSSREFTDEGLFADLQDAVDFINHQLKHHSFTARAWLNNREVKVRNRVLVGSDGEPFCTNQEWHDTFAPADYPKIQLQEDAA